MFINKLSKPSKLSNSIVQSKRFSRAFSSTTITSAFQPKRWLTSEAGINRKSAILFPGQGSQHVGMGKDFYDEFKCAREVFDELDASLGINLTKLIFDGDRLELTQTENAQPAILATSIAIFRVMQKEFGFDISKEANFALGHSLGEFSALVATEAISLSDAVKLVRHRGMAMHDCVEALEKDTLMSAVILQKNSLLHFHDTMEEIQRQLPSDQVAEIANVNSSLQAVISGTREGVMFAASILKNKKIASRAVDLPVSAPFHCSLMRPARVQIEEYLSTITIKTPLIPIVFNSTGRPGQSNPRCQPNDIRREIIEQIDNSVQWHYGIQFCKESGVDQFISIGPNKVLGNLARKDHPLDWIRCISTVAECKDEFGNRRPSNSGILPLATRSIEETTSLKVASM